MPTVPVILPALNAGAVPLGNLILDQARTRLAGTDVRIDQATLTAKVSESMSTAATLTVAINDPDHALTKSGVLGKPTSVTPQFRDISSERRGYGNLATIDLQTNDVWWRLDNFERDGLAETTSLIFEDRIAALLREHDTFLRASRSFQTRAQFVHRLVLEVKAQQIAFISPDEAVRQRIAAAKPNTSTGSSSSPLDVQSGFAPGANITVKHARADTHQRRVLDDVLRAGRDEGVTRRMMVAAVMTVTQESDAKELSGTSHVGPFQQDAGYGATRDRQRAYSSAKAFYKRWIARNGKQAAGDLAALIEKVQASGQGSLYGQWQSEAEKTVQAWSGDAAGDASYAYGKQYVYSRGEPGTGKRENSWDCSGRLAEEVVWNRFAVANALVFASDQTLLRQQPVLTVTPDTPGVTVDYKESRRRPVLSCQVHATLNSFPAGTGQVVMLDGFGQPDGRYLVDQRDWDAFTLEYDTLEIVRPHRQLPEPAHETVTVSASSADTAGITLTGNLNNSKVADFVREGARISHQNLPYVWGGGHGHVGQPSGGGYDCSGYISACAHAAGFWPKDWGAVGHVSGDFASWGSPGKGRYLTIWSSASHVFAEVDIPGLKIRWIDTSRQAGGPAGPHTRTGNRSTAGCTARHWPGT